MRPTFAALLLFASCASVGGFARGAYAPQYVALRDELGGSLGRVVEAAKASGVDVARIRDLVRQANASDPGAGTGALVQRVLILIALETATAGELVTRAVPEGPAP